MCARIRVKINLFDCVMFLNVKFHSLQFKYAVYFLSQLFKKQQTSRANKSKFLIFIK